MALEIDSNRQGCDVGRIDFYVDGQGGGASSPSLGAYAAGVDQFEDLLLQVCHLLVRVVLTYLT